MLALLCFLHVHYNGRLYRHFQYDAEQCTVSLSQLHTLLYISNKQ